MIQGIITKTGSAYAIRVPKRYIDNNNLQLGAYDQNQSALRTFNNRQYAPCLDYIFVICLLRLRFVS
jgi:hypothetical protein